LLFGFSGSSHFGFTQVAVAVDIIQESWPSFDGFFGDYFSHDITSFFAVASGSNLPPYINICIAPDGKRRVRGES
jgi:hypothetical protein